VAIGPDIGGRRSAALLATTLAALITAPAASAHPAVESAGEPRPVPPSVQEVLSAPVRQAAEPPLEPTPQDPCGRGSRPETDMQGRVPLADHESGRAASGYTCNTERVGRYGKETPFGTIGGFKVERYVDDSGRECAYYDTTLLYPTNALDQEGGVNVLDMSDPANPKQTDRLVTPAMLTPHESLVVSQRKGVLAAVAGNPGTAPGIIDVYDISEDCRHPELKSTSPIGALGHESGLAPDGNTFYSASPGSATVVGVDISNQSVPTPLWFGNYDSHGLSISDDGKRAYIAGIDSGLIILDTTEIQERVPDPEVREIARLKWDSMSIPQNAIPVTIRGKEYVMEIDEFGSLSEVGAARMINIENEEKPRVVSNLRLEVHQPENFAELENDPGTALPLQGYAGHYCNVPQRKNPGIVACSMILSGLRIFDVRDPKNPREIAYFNSPIPERTTPGFVASNWAMSSPSFVPERGEIWYSDGYSGFWSVRTTNGVWPFPDCGGRTSTHSGLAKRKTGTGQVDRIAGRGGSAKRGKGSNGRDLISARGGNDQICAASGDDEIRGDSGDDTARGQRGADLILGGSGDDALRGGYGNDKLVGGPGRDRLDCGKGPKDVAVATADSILTGCERVKHVKR
jgi:hypothetical protein